ncbi:hypothetical protein [Thermospira aquatica]|uniref:Uncharacterized protein n=1 Tax=Thermospira aquatica TaxID=2828656 RepID=A0AAX3BE46_9SPIR|nr:hypothetical protein [Thermospira aquatica]URA10520.1 hypothetical protein KDW03_01580 [Thermospira aquatica]
MPNYVINNNSANCFLKEYYWEKNNRKFSKKPLSDEDFHIALMPDQDLRNYVCYTAECKVYRDYTIKFSKRIYQIEKKQPIAIKPGDNVILKTWLDGSIHIFKKNIELNFFEIDDYGRRVSA